MMESSFYKAWIPDSSLFLPIFEEKIGKKRLLE